ncbi:major facilitator superfamily transporter [Patellaria atrata CBS 101060]|uniref:Major facilitator superfamily transporter n=1 Tax=Patellaria atrata CBS 101060 TaxID=1346257 RepID=A0A9P4VPM3_9PEZI|nr:major facilitator superfamily transporter [Patellaria atrata CBS 101060]
MTAQTTTTAVELQDLPVGQRSLVRRDWDAATALHDADNIIEASRIADAEAPEGGYGWIIVPACFVMTWWIMGVSYSWGINQAALVHRELSSPATLSFVGSLAAASISIYAIINARLIRLMGLRNAALLGILLIGSGQFLSSFCINSIGGLFVTSGVLTGIGQGFCFMVASVTPAQYFSKKRGLANGIVFSGGAFGGAVLSLVMDALITRVGPAWNFRIVGLAAWLSGLPAAWFIKERTSLPKVVFIDWRLFKESRFVIIFVAAGIAVFPLFVPPFFLPLYTHSLGLSSSTGAGLVAGFNFASAAGRILCGFMGDKIGPLNTLFISVSLSAISVLTIWPVADTLAPLIVFMIINGIANGGFFAIMPTVVGNIFGSARVSVVMGMVVTGWTGGYLMGAPIAGYILDAYGGEEGGFRAYRPAIFYAGSMSVVAASLVALVRLRINKNLLGSL